MRRWADDPGHDRNCQGRIEARRSSDGRSYTSGATAFWSPRRCGGPPAGARTEIPRRPRWTGAATFQSGTRCHEAERGGDRDRHPRQSARCLARFHRRSDRDHDAALASTGLRSGSRWSKSPVPRQRPGDPALRARRRLADNAIGAASTPRSAKAIEALKSKLTPEQLPRWPRSKRGSASAMAGRMGRRIRSAARGPMMGLAARATVPRLRHQPEQ